jgi:hypothetical protein
MKFSKCGTFVAGAVVVLLPLVAIDVCAAVTTKPVVVSGVSTPIDWAIDAYLANLPGAAGSAATDPNAAGQTPSSNLSAADRKIAREQLQMQFQALVATEQQKIVATSQTAGTAAAVANTIQALRSSVQRAAVSALQSTQGIRPKLGGTGPDQVFAPTANPCRIYDSRNGPGPLATVSARQIYTVQNAAGYQWGFDQGGTGVSGAGNCVGTVFPGTPPTAAVAIVSIVNTVSSGALQAWNGGTTLSGGAVLNWNAGDRLSNTTVVPMDRTIAPYPGSGAKRDIAVFNNSGDPVDFVIDIVGYFIENTATPLDCVLVGANASIPASSDGFVPYAACSTGYSFISGFCMGGAGTSLFDTGPVACGIHNPSGAPINGQSTAVCCRVPGL